jgi:hypothetical protein
VCPVFSAVRAWSGDCGALIDGRGHEAAPSRGHLMEMWWWRRGHGWYLANLPVATAAAIQCRRLQAPRRSARETVRDAPASIPVAVRRAILWIRQQCRLLGRGLVVLLRVIGRNCPRVLDGGNEFEPPGERDRLAVLVNQATLNRVTVTAELQLEANGSGEHAFTKSPRRARSPRQVTTR